MDTGTEYATGSCGYCSIPAVGIALTVSGVVLIVVQVVQKHVEQRYVLLTLPADVDVLGARAQVRGAEGHVRLRGHLRGTYV